MDQVCPYFKTSEEKHTINMCVALEHMVVCKNKIRSCDTPMCTFQGNENEMQDHNASSLSHHNALLKRAHQQLLLESKLKMTDAASAYEKKIRSMWSKTWNIEHFNVMVGRSVTEHVPLQSPTFRKSDEVWRLVLFPSDMELYLQLVSSKEPAFVKITFAVQDVVYGPLQDSLLEEGEMTGTLINIDKYDNVEVKVAVTTYNFNSNTQIPCSNPAESGEDSTETDSSGMRRSMVTLVNEMEKSGMIKTIIEKAKVIARTLPPDVGRGGRSGLASFASIDAEVREIFQARICAPESLAILVDTIVFERYIPQLRPRINLLDELLYDKKSDCSSMSLRAFGNQSLYVSGAIIKYFNDSRNS